MRASSNTPSRTFVSRLLPLLRSHFQLGLPGGLFRHVIFYAEGEQDFNYEREKG